MGRLVKRELAREMVRLQVVNIGVGVGARVTRVA